MIQNVGSQKMKTTHIILALFALHLSGCSKADPRLLGSWVSDAELSMERNRKQEWFSEQEARILGQKLGHLSLEYGRRGKNLIVLSSYEWSDGSNVYSVAGYTNRAKYKVVEIAEHYSRIFVTSDRFHDFTYVHFEKPDVFWVDKMTPEPSPREYFRKKE